MSRFDSPLDRLRIASPCSANWDGMVGDDRRRYCGDCKLNVYNLSGMTRYDAEHLFRTSEGRLCVRYFQRADGSILTQDCPVGWARIKKRLSVFATTVLSLILSLFGAVWIVNYFSRETAVTGVIMMPSPTPTPRAVAIMGNIAMPAPTKEVRQTF